MVALDLPSKCPWSGYHGHITITRVVLPCWRRSCIFLKNGRASPAITIGARGEGPDERRKRASRSRARVEGPAGGSLGEALRPDLAAAPAVPAPRPRRSGGRRGGAPGGVRHRDRD